MKKHLSVFMLMARSTIYKIISLLAVMTAVEAGLFWRAMGKVALEDGYGMELVVQKSGIAWIFGVCFLLLTVMLSMTGCEAGSKLSFLLKRLSVSEQWVFFWQSVYNALCYLFFWMVQILIAAALCQVYMVNTQPQHISNQSAFLAFYRSDFLHGLLPLDDILCWIRNGCTAIALGICSAQFPIWQRRRKGVPVISSMAVIAMIFFMRSLVIECYIWNMILALAMAALAVFQGMRREAASE